MPIPMDRARETIYADIKAKIEAGAPGFTPEAKLPTHHALADAYDVSRATISRVMEDLVAERLVETRGRRGTYVARRASE